MNLIDIKEIMSKIEYLDFNPNVQELLIKLIKSPEEIHTNLSNIKESYVKEVEIEDSIEYPRYYEVTATDNIEKSIEYAYKSINKLMPKNFNNFKNTWVNNLPFTKSKKEQFYDQYSEALENMQDAQNKATIALYGTKGLVKRASESLANNKNKMSAYGKYFITIKNLKDLLEKEDILDILQNDKEALFIFKNHSKKIKHKINEEMLTSIQLLSTIIYAINVDEMSISTHDNIVKVLEDFRDKYQLVITSIKRISEQIYTLNFFEENQIVNFNSQFKELSHSIDESSRKIQDATKQIKKLN